MYNIFFSKSYFESLNKYSLHYREYFENIYQDSGIWSEDQIIANYRQESKFRKEEIHQLIKKTFSSQVILGRTSGNTLSLPWRSKILLLSWEETSDTRFIETLEIK